MSEKAIEILEASKAEATERYRREIAEIDAAIGRLRSRDTSAKSTAKPGHSPVRPGQYAGLKGSEVLWPYLLERQFELPLPMKVVISDLRVGGAELGQPDREERSLKIAASNNEKYIYNENDDTWDLKIAKENRAREKKHAS